MLSPKLIFAALPATKPLCRTGPNGIRARRYFVNLPINPTPRLHWHLPRMPMMAIPANAVRVWRSCPAWALSANHRYFRTCLNPWKSPCGNLAGGDGGSYQISRLSRPVQKVRVPIGDQVVTIFNCHLKSKLGEFITPSGEDYAPEADLLDYDAHGRSLGALRAGLRRMAEAWVLRGLILDEINDGNPVLVLGDFNDGEHAVSSEIITGETPFKNYGWMRRHNASKANERYSKEEASQIHESIERRAPAFCRKNCSCANPCAIWSIPRPLAAFLKALIRY